MEEQGREGALGAEGQLRLVGAVAAGLHLLCASAILLLLWSPVQLTGISFQLTFAALLGITLISPYLD
ncbi:MAG: ComEC/Rec2 family competence protein, partial [Clostridia bacterium]|nr:ComEC/Rec2 family competence protein [Clostridia bacterium]